MRSYIFVLGMNYEVDISHETSTQNSTNSWIIQLDYLIESKVLPTPSKN